MLCSEERMRLKNVLLSNHHRFHTVEVRVLPEGNQSALVNIVKHLNSIMPVQGICAEKY